MQIKLYFTTQCDSFLILCRLPLVDLSDVILVRIQILAIVHLVLNTPELVSLIKVEVLIDVIGEFRRVFSIFFISLWWCIWKFILLLLELIHLFAAFRDLPDLIIRRTLWRIRFAMSWLLFLFLLLIHIAHWYAFRLLRRKLPTNLSKRATTMITAWIVRWSSKLWFLLWDFGVILFPEKWNSSLLVRCWSLSLVLPKEITSSTSLILTILWVNLVIYIFDWIIFLTHPSDGTFFRSPFGRIVIWH